jgi:DNA-binding NtrC family response regulator
MEKSRNTVRRALAAAVAAMAAATFLAACSPSATTSAPAAAIPDEGLSLEDNERLLLVKALEKTKGNQTQAARLLKITRDTLRYKMKKFSLR